MNLLSPTHPPLPPTSPSLHQCSLSASNSGKAAASVWVMASDAQVTIVQSRSVSAPPSAVGVPTQMSAEAAISLPRFEQKAAGPCEIRNETHLFNIRPVKAFMFIFFQNNLYISGNGSMKKCPLFPPKKNHLLFCQ